MAEENKFLFYKGFPLIRSGNIMFYGTIGDAFAARLTIKETRQIGDAEVPDKIMVQLLPKDLIADADKARKGDFTGFYEALNTAHLWITDALKG